MQTDRDRLVRRLGYYFAGLALGFVLLGIFFQGRRAQVARQQQEAARAEAERARRAAPDSSLGPGAAVKGPDAEGPAGTGAR